MDNQSPKLITYLYAFIAIQLVTFTFVAVMLTKQNKFEFDTTQSTMEQIRSLSKEVQVIRQRDSVRNQELVKFLDGEYQTRQQYQTHIDSLDKLIDFNLLEKY